MYRNVLKSARVYTKKVSKCPDDVISFKIQANEQSGIAVLHKKKSVVTLKVRQ